MGIGNWELVIANWSLGIWNQQKTVVPPTVNSQQKTVVPPTDN
ncbi:hypothetical protein QT971_11530 [Microcoleus sp. herbarium19]